MYMYSDSTYQRIILKWIKEVKKNTKSYLR